MPRSSCRPSSGSPYGVPNGVPTLPLRTKRSGQEGPESHTTVDSTKTCCRIPSWQPIHAMGEGSECWVSKPFPFESRGYWC